MPNPAAPLVREQVLLRVPPKNAFQFLYDPEIWEDAGLCRVRVGDEDVGEGFTWEEKWGLKWRTFTMTEFDRRGFRYSAKSDDLTLHIMAKKGGTGSTNAVLQVDGDEKALKAYQKRFPKGRLQAVFDWLESDEE